MANIRKLQDVPLSRDIFQIFIQKLDFGAIQKSVADLLKPTDRLGGKERVRCLPWLVQQFRKGRFLKETRKVYAGSV